ncbi:hypothetical protein BDR03DRAFT_1004694 [Suillus americanus]|nr:hypothetical protein BDR03DRAFT_1004694 [Suillus americanus]
MDVNIHKCNFMHFVHIGFATSIMYLAEQHGFQEIIIQNIYKQLETYVEVMDVVEAMQDAAEERVVAEILKRQEDRVEEEDKEDKEDKDKVKEEDGMKEKEDAVKEEE